MNTNVLFTLGLVISLSFAAQAKTVKRANFTECLQALSEYSEPLKGKVFPMTADGWAFSVLDEEKKETVVYLPNGEVYKISPTSKVKALFTGPHSCQNVTSHTTKGSTGAAAIFHLYEQAMKDSKGTSYENRKLIKEKCATVAALGSPGMMGGMAMGTGMMTGGTGMMMGGPSKAEKSTGAK